MEQVELKLKQASAVLGVPQKDLQNLVQAGVLHPRRRSGLFYFDTNLLLQAKVVFYLRSSLGASTWYLSRFAEAVAGLSGFDTATPDVVALRSSCWPATPPVEIRIPLGVLAEELRQRLPLAAAARDLPRGRRRAGWKRDFVAAVGDAAADLQGVTEQQLTDTISAHRRERGKPGLTVVAEAAEASA